MCISSRSTSHSVETKTEVTVWRDLCNSPMYRIFFSSSILSNVTRASSDVSRGLLLSSTIRISRCKQTGSSVRKCPFKGRPDSERHLRAKMFQQIKYFFVRYAIYYGILMYISPHFLLGEKCSWLCGGFVENLLMGLSVNFSRSYPSSNARS